MLRVDLDGFVEDFQTAVAKNSFLLLQMERLLYKDGVQGKPIGHSLMYFLATTAAL